MARRNDHSRDELKTIALETAKTIVKSEGFTKLTARRIAKDIGYTPGTIYNIFGSMDGLYFALNAQTLNSLYQTLSEPKYYNPDASISDNLKTMAELYMNFAQDNHELWLMIFNHALPDGEVSPEWYREKITFLFAPLEKLLDSLFTKSQTQEKEMAARVLWSSVHGICYMQQTKKITLISDHPSQNMANYLIDNFMAGLEKSKA